MTEAASIFVSLNGRDVGLSTLLTQVDQKTQKSADSAARLQSQYARLAATQGNSAQATNILTNALQNNGGASASVVASLSTQLATLQRGGTATQQFTTATQGLGNTLGQLGGQLGSLGGQVGSLAGSFGQLAGSMGTIGTIGATIGIAKVGLDMAITGGKILATRDSFDALAKSVGTTGDALLTGLRAAAQGAVTDADLIASANSGILLTGGKLAKDLPRLLEIARAASKATGEDVGFLFNSLVTGIARGSPKIIDNAKITLDSAVAFDTYAQSIGKSADQLTAAEQQQATLSAVLLAGNKIIKDTGGASVTTATQIAQGQVAITNLKDQLSTLVAIKVGPFAADLAALGNALQSPSFASAGGAFSGLLDTFARLSPQITLFQTLTGAIDSAGGAIGRFAGITIPDGFSPLRTSIQQWLDLLGIAPGAAAAAAGPIAGAFDEDRSAIGAAQAALVQFTATGPAAAAAQGQIGAAASVTAAAFRAQQGETNALAAVTQTSVQAGLADAAAKQEVAAKTGLLTAETNAAVTAFMNLHPNISASGVAALAAAGQIDPLLAQLIQARIRADEAAGALARFNTLQGLKAQTARQLIGPDSESADLRRNNRAVLEADRTAKIKAANDAAAAERTYQQTLGNTAPALAHARAELAQLTVGTAAYITKQNEIAQLQQKADRAAKGGGGGVKLSDQQKLNNQLLTDQEKANDQFEDAEAEHQQRLLAIQIDYAKKTLAQQKANEISKRQSQEDFYDRLTSSDLNKKKGGADALKAIDAQYQADYQKSQELAQQGKAKQSADLLALAQKQAQDELTYQENLAKAQEAKDKAEISRLEAIHKLHQDTAAEERKQVLEGGDANEQAKQQALDDEAKRYDESQDKIGTAAERAADRQAAAALRAGKAIDATNAKLGVTKSTYDQIAPSGGGSAPVTNATASAPPSDGSAPAAATSDPIAAAISALQDAISAKLDSVRSAADGTTSAVRGLQGKFAS
jgi:hypothetical protein